MKILHVVTLATPDGAYGGPLRVALNQVRGLLEAGQDATLAAGHFGYGAAAPKEIDGVPVHLFPVKRVVPRSGFAGLCSPPLDRWLRKRMPDADIVHIHLARDLITLPAAARALLGGQPYVVQPHGMVAASQNPLAAPLDLAITRRVLRGARQVFFLTPREKADLVAVAGQDLNLQALRNGVPLCAPETKRRSPGVEVLFLARLHARKRPLHFVAMAGELSRRFPEAKFTLVGPDEGDGPEVLNAIKKLGLVGRIAWEGAVPPDQVSDRMRRANVFVLPAVNEPFAMAVLEAMSLGLPAVVTESCGLAPEIHKYRAGEVVPDGSVAALVHAVGGLLNDKAAREAMGERGSQAVRSAFGMSGVIEQLLASYAGSAALKPLRAGQR